MIDFSRFELRLEMFAARLSARVLKHKGIGFACDELIFTFASGVCIDQVCKHTQVSSSDILQGSRQLCDAGSLGMHAPNYFVRSLAVD